MAGYFLGFVIPLILKEAGVKNGLRSLRYQMVATAVIVFVLGIDGLLVIFLNYFGVNIVSWLKGTTIINSILFLVYMVIERRIYTQQYTPKNKRLHEKIEKLEILQSKKVDQK
jgi:hypothetical protein